MFEKKKGQRTKDNDIQIKEINKDELEVESRKLSERIFFM